MYKAPKDNHIISTAYAVTTEGRIKARMVPPGGEAALYWDELYVVIQEFDALEGKAAYYMADGSEADECLRQVVDLYKFQQRFAEQVARSEHFGLTLKEFVGYVVSSLD